MDISAVLVAIGSAVLFGLSAPVAKILLDTSDPWMLAGILYSGAGIGLLWILARIHYAWSYYRDAAKRGPGYAIGLACTLVLLLGGIAGMLRAF